MDYSRDVLYYRHRLSHFQINRLLNEKEESLVLDEKLKQLNKLSKFITIVDVFFKHNIWFLPLKGPALSYRIYGDATCRISRDFDFLIRKENLYDVIEILQGLGFIYDSQTWPDKIVYKRKISSFGNQITMYHSQSEITIEVHWRLFIDPIIKFGDIGEIVQSHILQFDFMGRKMNQLTIEFELLYLIIHGGLHTWRRLKWLIDVYEIINRLDINADKFKQLTNQLGAQRMVGLCNELLRQFFPGTNILPVSIASVPDWFYKQALREVEREEDYPDLRLSRLISMRRYYYHAFPSRVYKQKRIQLLISSIKKLKRILPVMELS